MFYPYRAKRILTFKLTVNRNNGRHYLQFFILSKDRTKNMQIRCILNNINELLRNITLSNGTVLRKHSMSSDLLCLNAANSRALAKICVWSAKKLILLISQAKLGKRASLLQGTSSKEPSMLKLAFKRWILKPFEYQPIWSPFLRKWSSSKLAE